HADSIHPRHAESIHPRHAESIHPRHADAITWDDHLGQAHSIDLHVEDSAHRRDERVAVRAFEDAGAWYRTRRCSSRSEVMTDEAAAHRTVAHNTGLDRARRARADEPVPRPGEAALWRRAGLRGRGGATELRRSS